MKTHQYIAFSIILTCFIAGFMEHQNQVQGWIDGPPQWVTFWQAFVFFAICFLILGLFVKGANKIYKKLNTLQKWVLSVTIPGCSFVLTAAVCYNDTGEAWYHFSDSWPYMLVFLVLTTIFELWLLKDSSVT